MALKLDYFNKTIAITAPTTAVDAQSLHDFTEDQMASPVGLVSDGSIDGFFGDVLKPEGKIEDENNPGIFSQIILVLNPEWQIQFWQGSGYTRIFGGKIVGGVGGQPMKASGAAGDITVMESPVDGLTVATDSGGITEQDKTDIADANWSHASAAALFADVALIKDIEGGAWKITGNQMVFYKSDNVTEVMRFDLKDQAGNATGTDVFERSRV